MFYSKNRKDSFYLKYSGYENKYLIYNKDTFFMEESKKYI